MEKRICKTCGGAVKRFGNFYECEYCGNTWEIDSSDDVHAVARANAWESLRRGEFEKAGEQFEEILARENENYEAYWGCALADNGIIYVTDLAEDKKVPTCNQIREESFLESKAVQTAIRLAPEKIRKSYEIQAEKIEKIREEWLSTASKEPPCDVFLCYKDSEDGTHRTQDSIDAQDLYNALTEEGFEVFFSRVSLRDKVAERYEPYIYNAIKTAKVMIVFGEKPEYFSSLWVKNEWNRYKLRIVNGEKHKNSLVVVYKNMDPADLPVVLRSRQCLNAADMTFLSDLVRHIKRVIADSEKEEKIQKIQIHGGQIGKKAEAIHLNAVQVRDVGQGMITAASISEQQGAELLESYVRASKWEDAKAQAEDMLFQNPGSAEAIWYSLFAELKAEREEVFFSKLDSAQQELFLKIEKAIDCAPIDFADYMLETIYKDFQLCPEKTQVQLLEIALPYKFKKREQCIENAFQTVIAHGLYGPFCTLLTALDDSQVDTYISYHLKFIASAEDVQLKEICCEKILHVDEGNAQARKQLLKNTLEKNQKDQMISRLETMLRYAPDPDLEIESILSWLTDYAKTPEHAQFTQQLVRYYSGDLHQLSAQLIALSGQMIEIAQFDTAHFLLKLIMDQEKENPKVYWNLCMIKAQVTEEFQLRESEAMLHKLPEYKKYLSLVDEGRRKQCYVLEEDQTRHRCEKIWEDCMKEAKISREGDGFECAIDGAQMLVEMPAYQELIRMAPEPDLSYYIVSGYNQIAEMICSVEDRIKICQSHIVKPKGKNIGLCILGGLLHLAVSAMLFCFGGMFSFLGYLPLLAGLFFMANKVLHPLLTYRRERDEISQYEYELGKRKIQLDHLYSLEKQEQYMQHRNDDFRQEVTK